MSDFPTLRVGLEVTKFGYDLAFEDLLRALSCASPNDRLDPESLAHVERHIQHLRDHAQRRITELDRVHSTPRVEASLPLAALGLPAPLLSGLRPS